MSAAASDGRDLTFAIPGDPEQRTGGYLYDKRLAAALGGRGWHVRVLRLPETFPFPSKADLDIAQTALAELPDGSRVLIDGLAFSAMPPLAGGEGDRLEATALVHHPLGYETGLDPEVAGRLVATERAALAAVPRVVVTSEATKATLVDDFAVPAERIAVALPGTDSAPLARGSGDPTRLHLLAVGSVIPRKDFPSLVDALSELRQLPWRLSIVGSLERSAEEAARLKAAIEGHGLSHRIVLEGELVGSELDRAYDGADLLVSVSRYEGFGMALAEGLARGLPIVAVAGGAVGGWLPADAATLVPPDDPAALGRALAAAVGDAGRREALREGAVRARDSLPGWDDTAAVVERALLAPAR